MFWNQDPFYRNFVIIITDLNYIFLRLRNFGNWKQCSGFLQRFGLIVGLQFMNSTFLKRYFSARNFSRANFPPRKNIHHDNKTLLGTYTQTKAFLEDIGCWVFLFLLLFFSQSWKWMCEETYKFLEPLLVPKGDLLDYVKCPPLDIVQKISF